ncbi:MAG: dUTP diphosphatase [Candidatus Fonsibacter lacus]|uniref:Deoxyuridine 5'-triphosphate nucleotidohydrolase n=1 Tax=Candidatus Fonsibacter lacus TaxID=2576439 RepID=A0A966LX18_9PROT|nr:dUTP diphosphatase [Candidatus Fonsibacter lacus]
MVKILVKKINYKHKGLPKYETVGSSGLDLIANIDKEIILKSNERTLVPTGLAVAIPENYEIQVRPRSGLAAKNGISVLNTPGTVDADYRGEIKVILINLSLENFKIEPGQRIAQMVLCPVVKAELVEVDTLPESVRGSGGFGSTGR